MQNKDYLKILLEKYYPFHFFSLFRAHELYSVSPYLKHLQKPILDLGCGDGLIAEVLFDEKLEYGIDLSKNTVNIASKRNVYNHTFIGDAHNIPIPDNSLGGIFSNCVFEHIPNMDTLAQEISRVLKPEAILVTTCLTPQYYSLNPLFKILNNPITKKLRATLIKKENDLHNHVSIYSKDEYEKIFAKYGLILINQKYYSTKKTIFKTCFLDSISKFSFSKNLSHTGLYTKYLRKIYSAKNKNKFLQLWHNKFFNICYDKNLANEEGTAQVLVFKKVTHV